MRITLGYKTNKKQEVKYKTYCILKTKGYAYPRWYSRKVNRRQRFIRVLIKDYIILMVS